MTEEAVRQRLQSWMNSYSLPTKSDPTREKEQAGYEMLQNFFLLLLVCHQGPPPESAQEALAKVAEGHAWPVGDSPAQVALALGLGDPESELFALQQELVEKVPDERRGWLWQYGYLS